jgi:hypothetical protein
MSAALSRPALLFGMFELDPSGTVLYARAEGVGEADAHTHGLAGHNFFDEAARFSNAGELRRRINLFRMSGAQADSFDFTCEYDDGPVRVRVLLARIRERNNHDGAESVLIHVRRGTRHADGRGTDTSG